MHGMKTSAKRHVGLLGAVALLVAIVGLVPLFGSTGYAAAGPLDLNDFVGISEFEIPNGPITTTASKLGSGDTAPVKLTMVDDVVPLFPKAGEMVLGLTTTNAGGTELIVYSTNTAACGALTTKDVCVTTRAKVGDATVPMKQHPSGTFVQLATQLAVGMSGASSVAHTTLETAVSETQTMPKAISVGSDANFGTSGYLTIGHQDTTNGAGAVGAASPEPASEYFQYDRSCGSATQLCLILRALQPNEENYNHPADGYNQPGTGDGRSKVDKHDQITVKTDGNDGFFPTGALMIYQVDGSNNVINAELVGRNQAAALIKTVTIPGTEFHITSRGASASTYKKTDIVAHPADSIVVSASTHLFCRNRNVQPNPATPTLTSSVGVFPVCYTQEQPNPTPKVGATLNVPIIGSTLVVMNALNQPFLSTGGYNHILFGPVPDVDASGANAGTLDGSLTLISPCITNFSPGSNLQVSLTIDVSDGGSNLFSQPDTGTIRVVTDTILGPDPGNDGNPFTHDDCDDPAGNAPITITGYDWPGGKAGDLDPSATDDDTDGDGCSDARELDNSVGTGGQRDPWNKADFFDTDANQAVAVADIFAVAAKFGSTSAGGVPYSPAHDRGAVYGPMGHNLSEADGSITVVDIFAVAAQFGHTCL